MGLDAAVSCTCWRDGRTTSPPVPVYFNWDSGYLDVVDTDDYRAFSDWRASACEHEEMELAAERIGNWSGARRLESVVVAAGRSRFPILFSSLVQVGNGGVVEAELCADVVRELDELSDTLLPAVQLIDGETGSVLETIFEWEMWFRSERIRWIDGSELDGMDAPVRIRRRDEILFEAYEFSQDTVGSDCRLIRLDNRCSGPGELTVSAPFRRLPDGPIPHRVSLQRKDVRVGDQLYSLVSLRTIFAAAVEVGYPVSWC